MWIVDRDISLRPENRNTFTGGRIRNRQENPVYAAPSPCPLFVRILRRFLTRTLNPTLNFL